MIIRRKNLETFQADFPIRISNHTPQTPDISTSHVSVDLPSELHDNIDKEPPPITTSTDATIIQMEDIPMQEELENLAVQMSCWRNCAIL